MPAAPWPAGPVRARSKVSGANLDICEERQQRPVPEVERIADQPDRRQAGAASTSAAKPGRRRRQQQRRSNHRQQRPPAGECAVGCREDETADDHAALSHARHFAGADGRLTLSQWQASTAPANSSNARRERQIEGGDRIRSDQRDVEHKERCRGSRPPSPPTNASAPASSIAAATTGRTAPRYPATTDAAAASWRIRRRNSRTAARSAILATKGRAGEGIAAELRERPAAASRTSPATSVCAEHDRSAPEKSAGHAGCRNVEQTEPAAAPVRAR